MTFTTSQTIGPFFHEGLRWGVQASDAVVASGGPIVITGRVLDANGEGVPDALVECWAPGTAQAEQAAPTPAFRRALTVDQGHFRLEISEPAQPRGGAPAAFVTVFARGLLKHEFTAVFLDDGAGLDRSEILGQVPESRRATLLARRDKAAAGRQYQWDIRLQGGSETVFFDFR